jgi:hypothetical protein
MQNLNTATQKIEATFKWSAAEMLKAQYANMRSSPTSRKIRRGALIWGAIALLLGIAILIVHGFQVADSFFGLFLSVMGTALLLFPVWTRRIILQQYAKRPDRDLEVSWAVSPEEIFSKTEASDSRFEWRMISRVVESSQGFLLYPNDQIFHWLPKHAFEADGAKRFADLAESRVKRYDRIT